MQVVATSWPLVLAASWMLLTTMSTFAGPRVALAAPAYNRVLRSHDLDGYKVNSVVVDDDAYKFQYSVHDDSYGSNFGHVEERYGDQISGEYRVNLPDGRVQIVTYRVEDAASGLTAEVRYEPSAPTSYRGAPPV